MIAPYRAILGVPGAAAFVGAGFAARLAHLTTVLGIVFAVSDSTGSYGLSGLVAGAYALAYAFASPALARRADHGGQARVLFVAAVATTTSRAGFLLAMWLGAPVWVWVLLSAASGASMPSVGAFVRARWVRILDASALTVATSFESVVDEVLVIVGPIVVSMLAADIHPTAGFVLALVLAAAGMIALALQRRTEPLAASPDRRTRSPLMTFRFALLLVTYGLVGMVLTTIELGVVAFCQQHGRGGFSGFVLATLAIASAAAGLWYGAHTRPARTNRHLLVALPLLVLGTFAFLLPLSIGWLFAAAAALGLTVAPVLIVGYSLATAIVAPGQLTEGLTWMTTAAGIGISTGSFATGPVIDNSGTATAFALASALATTAMLVGFAVSRRSAQSGNRRRSDDPGTDWQAYQQIEIGELTLPSAIKQP